MVRQLLVLLPALIGATEDASSLLQISKLDKDDCSTGKCTTPTTTTPPPTTTTTTTEEVEVECVGTDCSIEELCEKTTVLDTSLDKLVCNNLGGFGPNNKDGCAEGEKSIRFAKSAVVNGVDVDLRITIRDGGYYWNANQDDALERWEADNGVLGLNGARGDFGNINIRAASAGATHTFRFDFVNSHTGEMVEIESTMFTFFDLDQSKKLVNQGKCGGEAIYSCDAANSVATQGTTLNHDASGSCMKFEACVAGVQNVQDFTQMTAGQKHASVVMEFHGRTGFDLDFELGEKSTRNFLFIGHPTFVCE